MKEKREEKNRRECVQGERWHLKDPFLHYFYDKVANMISPIAQNNDNGHSLGEGLW